MMRTHLLLTATLLLLALLYARCDFFSPEDEAELEIDGQPLIKSDLTWNVGEDGAVEILVEAEDPNGESLTLTITDPPDHGTVEVLDAQPVVPSVARQTAPRPPVGALPEARADEERPLREQDRLDELLPQKTLDDERLSQQQPAQPPPAASKNASAAQTASTMAGISVQIHTLGPSASTLGQVQSFRIRYTPEADFSGTDRFMFAVRNASGMATEAEVIVAIDAAQDAPRVTATIDNQTLKVSQTFERDLNLVFMDPDGDPLSYEARSSTPDVAQAEIRDNMLHVTAATPGTATITVTARDANALEQRTSFDVNVEADEGAPRVKNPIPDVALAPGDSFIVDLKRDSVFTDPGDIMTYSAQSSNPGVAQAEIFDDMHCMMPCMLRVTMQGTGVAVITVTAKDLKSMDGFDEFTVTTKSAVNAVDDLNEVTQEGLPPIDIDVLRNDTDTNDGPLWVAAVNGQAAIDMVFTANGQAEIVENRQRVRYTPDSSFFGRDSFTYTAQNNEGDKDQATVDILVSERDNMPPKVSDLDARTDDEGAPVSLPIIAYDPDGDPLTFSIGANNPLPPGLSITAINDTTAEISGTITNDAAGGLSTLEYPVEVTVEDNRGGRSFISFQWTVTNPIPEAAEDRYLTNEDETLTVAAPGVLENDDDPDLDDLIARLASNPDNGSVTLSPDGSFTYTPRAGFVGTDAFIYQAFDGADQSNRATVSIVVKEVNDSPTARDDNYRVHAGETLTVEKPGVLSNDTDPNDDKLTAMRVSTVTHGTLTRPSTGADGIDEDGAFIYVPNDGFGENEVETDTFTYRASDGNKAMEATVTILVDPLRNIPPGVIRPGLQINNETDTVLLPIQAFDLDDDLPLVFMLATPLPPGLSMEVIDDTKAEISGTITNGAAGTYPVQLVVTDTRQGQSSITFDWTVINPPPQVTNPASQGNNEGDTVSLPIVAADPDNDLPLRYEGTGLPPGLSIDVNTGLISGTIANGVAGPYTTMVTVTDDQGAETTVAFNWTVTNPPPKVTNPGAQSVSEGATVSLQIQATDDDSFTFSIAPNTSLPPDLELDANTGLISGTIAMGTVGAYTTAVTVTDDQEAVTTVQFDWRISNEDPVVDSPGSQINKETDTVSLKIQAFDPNGDDLTFSIDPSNPLPSGLSLGKTGLDTAEITGTIDNGEAGDTGTTTYPVTVIATDTQDHQGSASFDWTVINPPPVVDNLAPQGSSEGGEVSLQIDASDVDEDFPLVFDDAGTLPPGLSITAINDTTAEITGTIANGIDGAGATGTKTYTVEVTVTDSQQSKGSATFGWTVTNPAPQVTNPGPQTSGEGIMVDQLQIEATDDDSLSLSFDDADTLPPGLEIDENGLISGMTTSGAADGSPYTVEVTVSDNQQGATTVVFLWSISNEAPDVTNPGDQTNDEGDEPTLQIDASDPDGDSFTYEATDLPTGLSIDANTGLITGTIANGVTGAGDTGTMTYDVTVIATDTQGGQSSVGFDWTVLNPQPQVINPGPQLTGEGDMAPLQIEATDDDPISYDDAGTLPPNLAINPNTGEISGTITNGATAGSPYEVEVTVSDDQQGATTVAFQWSISNQAPVLTNPGNQTNDEVETITPLSIQAFDPNGDDLTFRIEPINPLPSGLSIDEDTGVISGTIDNGEAGATGTMTYTVTVIVTDQSNEDRTTFQWTVNNPPPQVTNPNQTNNDDDPVSLQIVAMDDDPIDSYAATGLPPGLTIDTMTGEIGGTIDNVASDNSPYTVEVTVIDDQGGQTIVDFDWTVNNPPPQVTNPGLQIDEENETISLQIVAMDDDDLTYSIDPANPLPSSLFIDPNTGEISGIIGNGQAGPGTMDYAVTVIVTDPQGGQASVNFDWTVNNPTPQVTNPGPQTNVEATLAAILIEVIDDDVGLNFDDGGTLPPGLSINENTGLITDTITNDAAGLDGDSTYSVTVTVTDPQGGQDSVNFDWTVTNPSPQVINPGTQVSVIDSVSIELQITATDDDDLTYSIDPANPLPPDLSINDTTGLISGTIDVETPGVNYSVGVTVDDGQGGVTTVSFDWEVRNPVPTLTRCTYVVGGEDRDCDDPMGDGLPLGKSTVTLTGTGFIPDVSTPFVRGGSMNEDIVESYTFIWDKMTVNVNNVSGTSAIYQVTVTNKAPGGGTSNAKTLRAKDE